MGTSCAVPPTSDNPRTATLLPPGGGLRAEPNITKGHDVKSNLLITLGLALIAAGLALPFIAAAQMT